MSFSVLGFVLMLFAKVIKYFRVWTARVANWRSLNAATARPPVFFVVIEEDALITFDAALVAIFGRANFGNIRFDANLGKNLLPNSSRLIVARNAVFFVTNKTSDVNFLRI